MKEDTQGKNSTCEHGTRSEQQPLDGTCHRTCQDNIFQSKENKGPGNEMYGMLK